MTRVILVHPSAKAFGYSFITPRWLYVIAAATPTDLVGDPLVVDEMLQPFDPGTIRPGDLVGIGINSGNCLDGYRVLREAKSMGATVAVGGVHATILPDEPLQMGADAVVTGNGDRIWRKVVEDAISGRIQTRYTGGQLPGEALQKARWDLLKPRKYMIASVQTVLGCPEQCSFCSVWTVDGRKPRMLPLPQVIQEVNELCDLGFRFIVFADDNFAPATLGRITREPDQRKRKELERIREERLRFFEGFSGNVPPQLLTLAQVTTEIVDDEEYLSAIYEKMKVRLVWVGVESFSTDGLKSANKAWNPTGTKAVESIRKIQEHKIWALSSFICGLESETMESIRAMRRFTKQSGTAMAQFTIYSPFPGSVDYLEMLKEKHRCAPKPFGRRIRLLDEKFWLSGRDPVYGIEHPNLTVKELLTENRKSWDDFYSIRSILARMNAGVLKSLPSAAKITYLLGSIAYKRLFGRRFFSTDGGQRRQMGLITRLLIRAGLAAYNFHLPHETIGVRIPLRNDGLSQL